MVQSELIMKKRKANDTSSSSSGSSSSSISQALSAHDIPGIANALVQCIGLQDVRTAPPITLEHLGTHLTRTFTQHAQTHTHSHSHTTHIQHTQHVHIQHADSILKDVSQLLRSDIKRKKASAEMEIKKKVAHPTLITLLS
jgi:hypothetical protein